MTEVDRLARNMSMLKQLHPAFAARIVSVLTTLASAGLRPRIQQAWRSEAEQLAAYSSGHSKLKWGFHNATAASGTPEALAIDLVDDDHPLAPTTAFAIAVTRAARAVGLATGIDWGLPSQMKAALNRAISGGETWGGKIGWDPLHIEWVGISVSDAKSGVRPSMEKA